VNFREATLKAKAFEMGLSDGKSALDAQTKAIAAYNVILEQTIRQQGNFKDTSDGLANSKKILTAQLKEASIQVGDALLPAVQELVKMMSEADIEGFANNISDLAVAFVSLAEGVGKTIEMYKQLALQQNVVHGAAAMAQMLADKMVAKREAKEDAEREKIAAAEQEEHDRKIQESKKRVALYEAELAGFELKTSTAQEILEQWKTNAEPFDFGFPELPKISPTEAKMREKGPDEVLLDELRDEIRKTEDDLFNMSSRSSNLAVSSMQRIGGGGGAYGELDLSRRQTKLQEQMVSLLEQLNGNQGRGPVSDF